MLRNKFEKRVRRTKCRIRRKALVELAGKKCKSCGVAYHFSAMDFHHRDPKQKSFGLSFNRMERPICELIKEAKKCDLLCSNCHRIRHFNEDKDDDNSNS